jgi:two-component system response regulator HydG
MPSIIISRDSQFEKIFPLQAKTQIGRGPDSDVRLESPGVSRVHAHIEQDGDRFLLVDKGSTNGTFVENQRVRRHQLSNGSSFRIQDYLLTFVEDLRDQDVASEDLATATLMEGTVDKASRALWQTHHATRTKGLQRKASRLMKMVSDLAAASADAEPAALVLDALLDITGAKRGIVALRNKGQEPTFTHMRGFERQGAGAKVSRTLFQKVLDTGSVVCLHCAEKQDPSKSVVQLGLKSILCVPLISGEQTIGCIYLDHPDYAGVFSETDRDLITAAAEHAAEAFLPDRNPAGGMTREDERLAAELKRQGIIARSPKTLKVFRDSQTISRYNVSVLLYGETGTGKEIIARYIHEHSGRKGRFIARNCSAIAATMFESELFGHEKGAFTGATEQKQGILELANHGTIFLDEIGDMPAELQAKMLRTLQEQEVWRVGGSAPVKIDVRVIAATHKDIKTQRKKLNFRDDLYYRLANVEITAHSLRERPEDIGPLCELILEAFCKEQPGGKKPLSVSPKALRLLEAYDWPGNIRELRNTLIQISLRCDGSTIEPRHLKGLIDVFAVPSKPGAAPLPPLVEVERVHIIKALKCTNWNKSAAAKVLSIDRNRLNRRLKTLGIDSP